MTTAFPSKVDFSADPYSLERDELASAYVELRNNYHGLMVSGFKAVLGMDQDHQAQRAY